MHVHLRQVVRHVAVNQWYMIAFFCAFLLVTTFGIMNILVSVIVEQTLAASLQNKQRLKVREEKAQRAELDSIKEIFLISDTDGSNSLDKEEFLAAVKNPEVQWRMKMLELPVAETVKLFGVLDGDGSQTLSYTDFIQGCAKLKGHAMSKDMLAVMAQAWVVQTAREGLEGITMIWSWMTWHDIVRHNMCDKAIVQFSNKISRLQVSDSQS